MDKKFDAVKMTREIRNRIYEEIKDMTVEERIKYFNEKGRAVEEQLSQKQVKQK